MPKLAFWQKRNNNNPRRDDTATLKSNLLTLPDIKPLDRLSITGLWDVAAKRHLQTPSSPLPRHKNGHSIPLRKPEVSVYSVFAHNPTPAKYQQEAKELQHEVRQLLSQSAYQKASKPPVRRKGVSFEEHRGPFDEESLVPVPKTLQDQSLVATKPRKSSLKQPAPAKPQAKPQVRRRPSLAVAQNFSRPLRTEAVGCPVDPKATKFARRRSNSVPAMPSSRMRYASTTPSPAWSRMATPSLHSPSMDSLTDGADDPPSSLSSILSFDTSPLDRTHQQPFPPPSPVAIVRTGSKVRRTPSRLVRSPSQKARERDKTFVTT